MGSFNYFSYTIQIESNWYVDTGLRDLEVTFFKANSTWINDICNKDLSDTPIYTVVNTHNLDMILQLKYMPIVMNPARSASSDWKSERCYGLWCALSSKRVRWPPIFFTFLIWSYHFLPVVKVLKKSVRGNFWARTSLIWYTPRSCILAVSSFSWLNLHFYSRFKGHLQPLVDCNLSTSRTSFRSLQ